MILHRGLPAFKRGEALPAQACFWPSIWATGNSRPSNTGPWPARSVLYFPDSALCGPWVVHQGSGKLVTQSPRCRAMILRAGMASDPSYFSRGCAGWTLQLLCRRLPASLLGCSLAVLNIVWVATYDTEFRDVSCVLVCSHLALREACAEDRAG